MNQSLIVYVSEGAVATFMGIAFLLLVMASVYDMIMITRRHSFYPFVRKLRRPAQPQVSVLVYSDNMAQTLIACLKSIRKSRYHHYDVVVINNASTDATKHVIKAYQAEQSPGNMRFYQKRKKTTKYLALQQGYQRSTRGELILVLNADSLVTPSFLKESVARFVADEKLCALRARDAYDFLPQFTTLVAQFWQVSYVLYQKSASVLHGAYLRPRTPAMYRALTFKKGGRVSVRYDASLVIRHPGALRLGRDTSRGVLLAAILIIFFSLFLITYFIIIATNLESSIMLTLSWLAVSVWCVIAVWSDETIRLTKKLELMVSVPLLYFFLYVQLLIWLFGFMREFSHTLRRVSIYS